jgi:hypothetical protein
MFKIGSKVAIDNDISSFYKLQGVIVREAIPGEAFPFRFIVKLDSYDRQISFDEKELKLID